MGGSGDPRGSLLSRRVRCVEFDGGQKRETHGKLLEQNPVSCPPPGISDCVACGSVRRGCLLCLIPMSNVARLPVNARVSYTNTVVAN